jgi:hypothetical protein
MAEESPQFVNKRFAIKFDEISHLPVHYVNAVNIQTGSSEFFFTLGTAIPPIIEGPIDLEGMDSINVHPLFRFAMSPIAFQQFMDGMRQQYELMEEARFHQRQQGEANDES